MADLTQAREYYEQARRQAQRLSANPAQSLRHLDEIRRHVRILAEARLGVQEIPLYRVVGTQSAMRADAFGAGFMPTEEPDTEFARKWMNVCMHHLQDGITDPLKVYEYLGEYYCIEGNKRASVMKFFGVYSARAEVIRLIPKRIRGDEKIEAFCSWMDYMKKGRFPNLYMTYPYAYHRLDTIAHQLLSDGKVLPDPAQGNRILARFETAYAPFAQEEVLPYYGDAFLEYLQIFGVPDEDAPLHILTEEIRTLLPQLRFIRHDAPAGLVLEDEDTKPSFLRRILPVRQPLFAFAYGDHLENNDWLMMHERARRCVQAEFDNRIRTQTLQDITPENAYEVLTHAAQGSDVLFVPSSWMMNTALRVSLENPECIVLQHSMAAPHHKIHTYFSRYYECVYLCGMLAAALSTTNTVGYLTPALSIRHHTLDLNAFTLGVHAIRPGMRVCIAELTRPESREQAALGARLLHREGADLAMYQHTMREGIEKPENSFSFLARMDAVGRPCEYLAAPIWNWPLFYSHIASEYLSGAISPARNREETPFSYWWGMDSGLLDLHVNRHLVPPQVERLIRHMKQSMQDRDWFAYQGPITDHEGILRLERGKTLSPEDIVDMNWLTDQVERILVDE